MRDAKTPRMLKNSIMNNKEQEMRSQLNKIVTSDVVGDAVIRSRQDRGDSMVFDRGKAKKGLLEPEGSLNQEGQRTLV